MEIVSNSIEEAKDQLVESKEMRRSIKEGTEVSSKEIAVMARKLTSSAVKLARLQMGGVEIHDNSIRALYRELEKLVHDALESANERRHS